ncbi:uncharacterized protein LOC128172430 [Crassostrea angulata]|uniref:uncharacterized protein LOC128172430 n=1 Tax=Magallana angulata TaxID=2784310 RepID=UPI0022B184A3|nr:uncharacterized protein LOC128172430 [Crassostrea angulata]
MRLLITMLFVIFYMRLLAISKAYVNVALNKPAYQQYQSGGDRYDASNAVDGRKSDLGFGGGQCAVLRSRQTATWWVNLTRIHSIHQITFYFRTNNDGIVTVIIFRKYIADILLGFSVYVSNTTERSQGTLCFKDDNFTRNTIPSVFTTNCFVHGQYVIYYNERQNTYKRVFYGYVWIVLCEVEVFGCPVTGFYGSNCSIPCPDVNCQYCHIETGYSQCCKPGYQGHHCEVACPRGYFGNKCTEKCNDTCSGCNNVNGVCDSGCIPGWRGYHCNEECDRGWYGIGCNETCGHCRNESQCSNVNGTCLIGCDAGFQGDQCKTCEYTCICYGTSTTAHRKLLH